MALIEEKRFRLSSEVAAVIELSIDDLLAQRETEAVRWSLKEKNGLSPIFRLEAGIMFGATAHALFELICLLAPLYGLPSPTLVAGNLRWSDLLPHGFDDGQNVD